MIRIKPLAAPLLLAVFAAGSAAGQDMFIYPSQGQSAEQQEKDKFECYSWAKGSSGFDPMQTPQATSPAPQAEAPQGGAGRGALRGALVGAAVGEIADDDAGKGAAIGAVSGGLFGGMRRRDQVQRQQQSQAQWEQEQAAAYTQKRGAYDRAYSACLEGRGYTVK